MGTDELRWIDMLDFILNFHTGVRWVDWIYNLFLYVLYLNTHIHIMFKIIMAVSFFMLFYGFYRRYKNDRENVSTRMKVIYGLVVIISSFFFLLVGTERAIIWSVGEDRHAPIDNGVLMPYPAYDEWSLQRDIRYELIQREFMIPD